MKRLLVFACAIVPAVVMCGCAAAADFIAPPPDPRPQANVEDLFFFASKDTDPADKERAAAAIARAKELAIEAGKRAAEIDEQLRLLAERAHNSGAPGGDALATVLGAAALGFTTLKTALRIFQGKVDKAKRDAASAPAGADAADAPSG